MQNYFRIGFWTAPIASLKLCKFGRRESSLFGKPNTLQEISRLRPLFQSRIATYVLVPEQKRVALRLLGEFSNLPRYIFIVNVNRLLLTSL